MRSMEAGILYNLLIVSFPNISVCSFLFSMNVIAMLLLTS